ncbi:hypothetical protein Pme01_28720 [Planosporangium mesophilum]|uniref:Uncharacterized protein n=1 Tax=Planosporangium mesophilum TaxID=689768 RepID=A0A8J3T9Y0_9ACTN|nr:hypothetical protein Pme01_28720 [Planosporangium mesophilum]
MLGAFGGGVPVGEHLEDAGPVAFAGAYAGAAAVVVRHAEVVEAGWAQAELAGPVEQVVFAQVGRVE